MGWRDLTWRNTGSPIQDVRVQEVEQSLGVVFPDDFRECIKRCHGGSPSKQDFRVPAAIGEFGSCVGFLLSFDKDSADNIETICNELDDRPNGVIPIAEDGGGDFICLDYNKLNRQGEPTVLYWHRTGLPGNEFTTVSDSFSGLVETLT